MTDMSFADNAISTKALQKCKPFCPIDKYNWHHFIIFFPIGLSTCILMEIWTYMIYINDVQLFVTFQRKNTKTPFWSDITKIRWTQKPCSYSYFQQHI